ncbi:M14 family zinc carboxypeptidase [Patulibacter minatonensis]|uniref:M14 family zinc carboxypeptidase n=1 Tax=Patulibacter minatonensis TaxID=298163 RepID=UPI00047A7FE2|nr:M14 family zinc carboxypeptidase [Patulibacter minatonensis]
MPGRAPRRALPLVAALAALPVGVALLAPSGTAAGAGGRATTCPAVAGAAALPTADAVLGRPLDAAPLSPEDADRYLLALDAASARIVTGVAGRSVQGRPLRYALVGDPRALAPARRRAISAALRAVRRGDLDTRAVDRAAAGPAVVWIGAGVHANEPSGTTASLALLRRLGTDDSCATRRTLRATLAVVVPDQNPDGRAIGTRTNAADVDLNRDWFAGSQPETTARTELLSRFPPTVALDAHEQTGTGYFVPPYAAPVVAGLPHATRRLADRTVSGAIDRALGRIGTTPDHGDYDLLFPGYADSATSLLFGAGGMTLEQGSDVPLPEKARRHETAMLAALEAVGRRPEAAIRDWAAGFAAAERAGREGRGTVGDRSFGWALRTDHHGADATALALRLRRQGVHVRVLRRPARLRLDPLGPAPTAATTLPAGTIVVPAAQPLARWADVLLGRDADEAGAASAGADTWSVPRAAGVDAAVVRSPLPTDDLARFGGPATSPAASGSAVAFDADSAAGSRAALAALAAGRPVTRTTGGNFRTSADPAWSAAAAAAGVEVRASGGPAAGDVAVPPVHVVVPEDPTPLMTGTPAQLPVQDRPEGWVTGALRAGHAAPTVVTGAALAAGVPSGTTHLVLGPAALTGGATPEVRASVDAFVRGGGTVVALGAQGVAATRALGLSGVTTEPAPGSGAVAVRAVPGADRVGHAIGSPTSVTIAGEPLLSAPAGAAVSLRAGTGDALAPSGAAGAGRGLAGRPLVVDETVGAGHVLSVGFSPAFRRQSDGGEHVLLALLLAGR